MVAAWLLRRSRWARFFYLLGVHDGQVPTAVGAGAARLRAAGWLDKPRHRADKTRLPVERGWEVGVG